MTPHPLLKTAMALHQKGLLREAEKAYRALLAIDTGNADALALLGGALSEQKKHEEAVASISAALKIDPTAPLFHFYLGNAHDKAKRFLEAETAFAETAARAPQWDEAWYNLGNTQRALEKNAKAIESYVRTLALNPRHALAHNNIALLLSKEGKYTEARQHIDQGLAASPNDIRLLLSLSDIAFENNDLPTAFSAAEQVARLKLGIYEGEIIPYLSDTARINSTDSETRNCIFAIGTCYLLKGQLREASYVLRTLLSLEPDLGEPLQSLGSVALAQNQLELADAQYSQAFMLDPTDLAAPWNRSMALLTKGELGEGFRRYRWRWNALEKFKHMALNAPRWDSSDPAGKTILIHEEQGFGDSLQMLRFVPELKKRGARVYLYARPVLQSLLEGWNGCDKVIAWNVENKSVPAEVDCVCGGMDLPGNLGISLNTIPADVPYLPNPKAGGEKYKLEGKGLKIGLVYAGNPLHKRDHERSISFELFEPILELSPLPPGGDKGAGLSPTPPEGRGVRFYSFQFKPKDSDKLLMQKWGVRDLHPEIKNLADTAAFLANLDLLITIDSAPLHLAGALGKPVWGLITSNPDWRWLLNRQDSPWYPSLRLFRQQSRGDWPGVITNVQNALMAEINI